MQPTTQADGRRCGDTRPKRARFASTERSPPPSSLAKRPRESQCSGQLMGQHPLRVRPMGNALFGASGGEDVRSAAGKIGQLPDEVVVLILEQLDSAALVEIGRTGKFLYAFSRMDELWRGLAIRTGCDHIRWRGSWRGSMLGYSRADERVVDCNGLYSDVIHRPFQCANLVPNRYAANIPASNQIRRLSNLSYAEFAADWAKKPFILTGPVKKWPAFRDWTVAGLVERYGDVRFQAEAVEWTMRQYVDYMTGNQDESPLYLFDHAFADKMAVSSRNLFDGRESGGDGDGLAAWTIPDCFSRDLFSVLGQDRPHHRWLIVGPARSGSTFHKDPNGTSAWNAVLTGSKYWLMFPSSSCGRTTIPPPPGVFVSEDGSEVTSPLSLAEYLLVFHAAARRTAGAQEGICRAGEMVHVPAGWFHMVVNLDDSLAITQNFVPPMNLPDVLAFLRDQPDEVSGFECESTDNADRVDPYNLFLDRLRDGEWKDELEKAEIRLKSRDEAATRWQRAVQPDEASPAGFSFGFSL